MILVIANYRTGSSTLVKQLCEAHRYSHSTHSGEKFINGFVRSFALDSVVKVMPDQIEDEKHWRLFEAEYCAGAEKIYYSLRRDFTAQCNSYAVATATNQWHPEWVERHGAIRNGTPTKNMVVSGRKYQKRLKSNLEHQARLYRLYPGKLMWLEDRVQDRYSRLNTPRIEDWRSDVDPVDYFL